MILWIVLTMMAAVAAILVATPFIRGMERRRAEQAFDVAVYRDQLKEVDAEAAQGLIDAPQAEAAKQEIKRRVLASARDADAREPGLSSGEKMIAAVGVAAVVVLGSVGLFALTGNVEQLAEASVAENDSATEAGSTTGSGEAATAASGGAKWASPAMASLNKPAANGAPAPSQTAKGKALPSVDEMIQRIVKRLDANPKDVGGWRMLGWSYFGMEHYQEAADAYGKAIELAPNLAELRSARADALIHASGSVTPEAKTLITEALEIDSKDVRARYLKGVIKEQEGDKAGAIADWSQLLSDSDPNEAFVQELKQKIATAQGGPAPAAQAAPAAQTSAVAQDRGPTAQDVKNAESMEAPDRNAMIKHMVDQLAARLEKSPHDAEGWIKLMRSRVVLQQSDEAKLALERALKEFESDHGEHDRIAAIGRELGVTP